MNLHTIEITSSGKRILPGQALCVYRDSGHVQEYVYRHISSDGRVLSLRPGDSAAVGLTFSGERSLTGPQRVEGRLPSKLVDRYFEPREMAVRRTLSLPRFAVEDQENGVAYYLPVEGREIRLRQIQIPFLEVDGRDVYDTSSPEGIAAAVHHWEFKVLDAMGEMYFPNLYLFREGEICTDSVSAAEADPSLAYPRIEDIQVGAAISWVSGATETWVPNDFLVLPVDDRTEEEIENDAMEEFARQLGGTFFEGETFSP